MLEKVWQKHNGTKHRTFRVPRTEGFGETIPNPQQRNGTQIVYFPEEKPKFCRESINMLMLPTCFLFRAKEKQLM